jgi:hypothetical protein
MGQRLVGSHQEQTKRCGVVFVKSVTAAACGLLEEAFATDTDETDDVDDHTRDAWDDANKNYNFFLSLLLSFSLFYFSVGLELDRYKYLVQVLIGDRDGAGVR